MRYTRGLERLIFTPEFNVVLFSFLLNLPWEVWQVPFFQGMADQPYWLGVKACTKSTFGDAAIGLAAFWIAAIVAKSRSWILQPRKLNTAVFLAVGILATIIVEALATGPLERWTYDEAMPRLPILGTGLLPLLQWLLLPSIVLYIVRRQIGELEQSYEVIGTARRLGK